MNLRSSGACWSEGCCLHPLALTGGRGAACQPALTGGRGTLPLPAYPCITHLAAQVEVNIRQQHAVHVPRQPGRATAIGRRDVGAAVEVAEVLVRGAAVTRGEGVGEALGADTVDGGREAAVWKGWQSEVTAQGKLLVPTQLTAAVKQLSVCWGKQQSEVW